MGKSSSPPPAPDPTKTAQAQSQYDKDTALFNAQLNRPNVVTPFGSQTWSGDPTHATQTIQLTPDAQQALKNTQQTQSGLSSLQQQALGGVGQTLAQNPFDKSQLPALQVNPGQTAQDAIMSRLNPQIDMENKSFEQQMANRGIPQGSEAYDNARRSLGQQQNDRQIQAASTGIGVGEDARKQAIQEQGYYANAPLNYLNGLMTGSQVQTPQFQATPSTNAAAPNYQQAVQNQYQGQLNAFNSQAGSSNSMMSGLMAMAPYIMMAMA